MREVSQDEIDAERPRQAEPVTTTSVEGLMRRHHVTKFEFVKIDIEGAEHVVFARDRDLDWLQDIDLMAMEIHDPSDHPDLLEHIKSTGLVTFLNGEYTFFASPQIATVLDHPH